MRVTGTGFNILADYHPNLQIAVICVNFKLFTKELRKSSPDISVIFLKSFCSKSVHLNITLIEYDLVRGFHV